MSKSLIPKSAYAHHIAVLGKTGSGKTSVAKAAIVEPALEAEERVCIIDPTGAWWGLRLKADGRTKGFPAYIFGGRHKDYPLLGSHGEAMAQAIGTTNTPAVLDTSLMKNAERMRFFTDFADALLRYNEGPLRLVIDEAHVFMPQAGTRGSGAMPDMLHAGNNLISLGRSRGLRIVLISQRAAKLHKDSLTQVETLIALRLIAPQDRTAVREWIADQADVEKGKDIIASLPKQNNGQGWVWAPEADFLKQIQFPRPVTYDSSAAPTSSKNQKKLSPVDIDALKGKLAKVEEEARQNDPNLLRADVAKLRNEKAALERQVAAAATAKATAAPPDKGALVDAELAGFKKASDKLMKSAEAAARKRYIELVESLSTTLQPIAISLKSIAESAKREKFAIEKPVHQAAPIAPAPRPAAALHVPKVPPASNPVAADGELSGSDLQMLGAIAYWDALGFKSPTRVQVAAVAGWRVTSGHLRNVAGSLKTRGYIDYPSDGKIALTDAGAAVAPAADTSTSVPNQIRKTLDGSQRQAFDFLQGTAGRECTREDLAQGCGWTPTSGHLRNVLGSLRSLEIITYPSDGRVAVADWVPLD